MIARAPLLHRLDARDRALFVRWVLDELAPARTTRAVSYTHLTLPTSDLV